MSNMSNLRLIITTTRQLRQLIYQLDYQKTLAIDTEFYWRYRYYPELCLIQIATSDNIYLIDAMAEKINLSMLRPIFFNQSICKIMHSSKNDIKILKHYVKTTFNNIFDTQTAMAFLGYPHQMSLKNILETLNLFSLNKQEKMSDWRLRPLTKAQISYAKADVAYLHEIYNLLKLKLIGIDHDLMFREEMNEICKNTLFSNLLNGNLSKIKTRNNYRLPDKVLINKAFQFLQELAQEKQIAAGIICSKHNLIKFIQSYLEDPQDLKSKLSSGWRYDLFGQKILQLVSRYQLADAN